MKKIIPFFLVALLLISPFFTYNLEAKTLRDYYADLSNLEAKKNTTSTQKAETESKIRQYNQKIASSQKSISDSQNTIIETKNKIEELNKEIEAKKEEIKNLLRFKQVSSGENVYLEYVFNATDFTDFIYRSAIVEQLSIHNEKLIKEMYDLIEQNKKLATELEEKITEEKKAIEEFNKLLKSLNIEISDISDMQMDIDAEIKALKAEIKYLEDNNCELDESIEKCIDMPFANGFIKPTKSAYVTDEYGNRWHPTLEIYRLHAGIDLGVSEGTNVYPAAAGIVSNIVYRSNCGGNIIRIKHIVNGTKYTTTYMHLLTINVREFEIVTSNTVIGLSGGGSTSTKYGGYDGCTTGAHLHFEMHYGEGYYNDSSFNPRYLITFPPLGGYYSTRY